MTFGLFSKSFLARDFTNGSLKSLRHFSVENGGGYACMGVGVYGESLYCSFNFAMNLKLL